MLKLIYQGGLLMIPIGLCSILAVMFTVERFLYLYREHTPADQFWDDIEPPLHEANWSDAIERAQNYDGLLADMVIAGLSVDPLTPGLAREEMEDMGMEFIPELERFLPAINFIARVSPLLGLLGTVSGMIQTFSAIAQEGIGQPDLLAGGISQALVTTASGLTVGILALFFHHLLSQRVDGIIHDLELSVRRVESLLGEKKGDES
ncbi:MAG: MotA/TolQ/ExbB proton channel family protein [bacterium]